jgi:hypothetical protein
MKKIISFLAIFCLPVLVYTQTAIDKRSADGAGILDFKAGTKRAIVLPQVLNTASIVTPGTLFYDTNLKKVMYKDNNGIKDLSINTGIYNPIQNYETLISNANKVSIVGSKTSSATGVLILESDKKALVLPKIASPQLNIINPEPGTICYDTDKKLFCVFNGKEWTFWGE